MEPTHTPDVDFGTHAHDVEAGDLLRSPVTEQIAAELPVPPGAVAADVGCGAGGMTLQLAERVGPAGRVLAVDREAVLLDRVRERARANGVADRVHTVRAGIDDLPAALPAPAALVWAGHVVHHVGDQAAAVRRLAGALEPGGLLAIAEGGVPPQWLPWDVGVGRPGIEARLVAAQTEWFGAMRAGLPGSVRDPRGWSAVLRGAGLVDVTSRAWLLHVPAPLSAAQLAAVLHGLANRVERAQPWLSGEDVDAWARLLDEGGPDWLGRREDLEGTVVEVVQLGRRPA